MTEYTICIKKKENIRATAEKKQKRDFTNKQIKIKQRNDPRKWTAIYAIVIF